ncbi:hypothetical Protein YC6258_05323 [Gynuella sunshinyii YC6258]|uniref:Uncharacterized protein n=1 Tax=Gynuella sunshinyii YC6258 TaxID=1445510 RepID=A0A0C5VVM5_9GAMM|nr:hypothetical Protein YC6258_05323 [Gynuella sunshinyii YC6258]
MGKRFLSFGHLGFDSDGSYCSLFCFFDLPVVPGNIMSSMVLQQGR